MLTSGPGTSSSRTAPAVPGATVTALMRPPGTGGNAIRELTVASQRRPSSFLPPSTSPSEDDCGDTGTWQRMGLLGGAPPRANDNHSSRVIPAAFPEDRIQETRLRLEGDESCPD